MEIRTTTLQNVFRVILGIAMLYIGIGHFTFSRIEFQAQVPTWLTSEENLIDFIILASGIIEIILGALMIWGGKVKVKTGIALAIFYILIFPGNINQYINGIDAFNLNTDTKRLVRLFFQPLLLLWALWSTGGLRLKKNTNLK